MAVLLLQEQIIQVVRAELRSLFVVLLRRLKLHHRIAGNELNHELRKHRFDGIPHIGGNDLRSALNLRGGEVTLSQSEVVILGLLPLPCELAAPIADRLAQLSIGQSAQLVLSHPGHVVSFSSAITALCVIHPWIVQ